MLNRNKQVALDLGNSARECVKITADGWNVTSNIRKHAFTAGHATDALPKPAPGAGPEAVESLCKLLNIISETDWSRIFTWLTTAITGRGPIPVIVLQDPPEPVRAPPRTCSNL